MKTSQNDSTKTENIEHMSANKTIKRRTILKALVGIPVLGVFAFELLKKFNYDKDKKNRILKDLGLDNIKVPEIIKSSHGSKNDLIKVGMIGFGSRASALASGLGFMHPDEAESRMKEDNMKDWLAQEDLNVAITGICDVYDKHAEYGIATAASTVRPGGAAPTTLPIKRYRTFMEMLDDKDIDAVMIATPDHHHAPISIAAALAGKHVYCEKAPVHKENEINTLYETVRNSKIIYQLGHQITQSVIFQQARDIVMKDIIGKITLVETSTNRNTADGAWIRHLDSNGNPKPGDEKSIDWQQFLGNAPKVPFSIERYYSWTKYFDYDTGLLGQLFTHEYDAVNQLLHIGIPKSVVSSGGIYYWKDGRDMADTLQCTFEYPDHDLTLLYSASLANSQTRGRSFMGHDATMVLGNSISITVDGDSTKYNEQIKAGLMDPSTPMISFNPNAGSVDAVSSPTEKYYASRGLTTTNINGVNVDVTYLHVRDWLDCIRTGRTPTVNIEKAYEEAVTLIMAHKSYVEKRRVEWDPVRRVIV